MEAKRNGVALAAGLLALAIPASASAATTIGETFVPGTSASATCGANFTRLQSGSPNGQYAAPSAGVITSWSFQAGSGGGPQIKLKVGRSLGGNDFRIVGESELKTPVPDTLNVYTDIRIPVQPGDVIGNYTANVGPCYADPTPPGYISHFVIGEQKVNTQATFSVEFPPKKHDISATLEPDCDSDDFGDETQDPDTSSCNLPPTKVSRTLTLDASKNRVKKGKRVTLAGQLNEIVRQGPCESNQPVLLQRKKPSQTTFTTVEQLRTDAAGNFSTKKKVKKTFEYRGEVVESTECQPAVSNTEKVKVKRPA